MPPDPVTPNRTFLDVNLETLLLPTSDVRDILHLEPALPKYVPPYPGTLKSEKRIWKSEDRTLHYNAPRFRVVRISDFRAVSGDSFHLFFCGVVLT